MNIEKPRLLDLFCGGGGCSVGYHRSGFLVTGVDLYDMRKYYPYSFFRHDALDFLDKHGHQFDAIHASPPCKRFTVAASIHNNAEDYPDLLRPVRRMLISLGKPWVIENVPGAPMYGNTVTVCGLALGLNVKRHRLFQSSISLSGTECPPGHPGDWISVFGTGGQRHPMKITDKNRRHSHSDEYRRKCMDIDWMTRSLLSQAIPPPYTEYIGRQLIQAL